MLILFGFSAFSDILIFTPERIFVKLIKYILLEYGNMVEKHCYIVIGSGPNIIIFWNVRNTTWTVHNLHWGRPPKQYWTSILKKGKWHSEQNFRTSLFSEIRGRLAHCYVLHLLALVSNITYC